MESTAVANPELQLREVLDRDNEKSRSFSPDDKGVDFCEQCSISVNKESTHATDLYLLPADLLI